MSQKDDKDYIPSKISLQTRALNLVVSIFFIIVGGYGVWQNDLMITLGGGRCCPVKAYHLHDQVAILMYLGLLLVSICLISEIVDHYDKRNNEQIYRRIANLTMAPGVILCVIGLLIVVGAS